MNHFPTIKSLQVDGNFKYLWMKYINGFNLDVHCAKCLKGMYSKRITNNRMQSLSQNIDLNEDANKQTTDYYYLCGVSQPYNWNNNFHLAFAWSEGDTISVKRNGIRIKIENAKEIPIIAQDNYYHDKGDRKEFNTCRNWQFAYQQVEDELDFL